MEKTSYKYNNEKESLTRSKQKEILEELANKRMEKIQDSSRETDFNDLEYQYKGDVDTKKLIQILKIR